MYNQGVDTQLINQSFVDEWNMLMLDKASKTVPIFLAKYEKTWQWPKDKKLTLYLWEYQKGNREDSWESILSFDDAPKEGYISVVAVAGCKHFCQDSPDRMAILHDNYCVFAKEYTKTEDLLSNFLVDEHIFLGERNWRWMPLFDFNEEKGTIKWSDDLIPETVRELVNKMDGYTGAVPVFMDLISAEEREKFSPFFNRSDCKTPLFSSASCRLPIPKIRDYLDRSETAIAQDRLAKIEQDIAEIKKILVDHPKVIIGKMPDKATLKKFRVSVEEMKQRKDYFKLQEEIDHPF